eukprot:gnl/TRDRNA2_/TRDRNA2_91029_c0_seq1.p1 gnl/TRDRNA2_/TRDRNA2_91029_c0~~gnl/TRDRNA2_/TRDRNA2_91029_c0_seq1.p1  ORF type:complete len:170 (+),score=50.52 gnl/TRDRNA2_/TRDRNA2_91029_c0_seq1:44-553(+)
MPTDDVEKTLCELGLPTAKAKFMHGTAPADIKAAYEKYGDIGGNLKSDGTTVRKPWAGFPPEFWSTKEAAIKYMEISGEKTWDPPPNLWKLMTQKLLGHDPTDVEEILKAFHMFDDDKTGKITWKNLRRVATEVFKELDDEELQGMIDDYDGDDDGEINQEEFLEALKS